MRTFQLAAIIVSLLLVTSLVEAKKKKHKSSDPSSSKTKTKTKWSSSTDMGANSQNSMVATEEHGYYVKRTFLPVSSGLNSSVLKSPPFLAVPIAWFSCQDTDCMKLNSLAINSNKNSMAEGFLCDDDCAEPYEPVCGKTTSEVAVFYNKCKLNVAKCRSHGYWSDLAFAECKTQYPEEVKYADMKFRANPFFNEKQNEKESTILLVDIDDKQEKPAKPQEAAVVSILPEQTVTEKVLIKEIQDTEASEKQLESKDHYKEIKATILEDKHKDN